MSSCCICIAMEDKTMTYNLADTIIERPHAFEVSGRPFYLYPMTLGKSYLISKLVDDLGISEENISINPYLETLRVIDNKKIDVIRLIVYHTIKDKDLLFDYRYIESQCKYLEENLLNEEIAELFILATSYDKTDAFIKHLGIDKEMDLRRKIASLKKDESTTVNIGGKSVYGTMIDFACERYGWSYEYVLWGISIMNLKMLMSDYITSQYLTKEEWKKLRIPKDRTIISGDSKENIARAKKFFKD